MILLHVTEVEALIRRGYLDQRSRDDHSALEFAINAFTWGVIDQRGVTRNAWVG